MSRFHKFRRVCNLVWEAWDEHHAPTRDALLYYKKYYEKIYPGSIATTSESLYETGDICCSLYIRIEFKNEEDEAEFILRQSA